MLSLVLASIKLTGSLSLEEAIACYYLFDFSLSPSVALGFVNAEYSLDL